MPQVRNIAGVQRPVPLIDRSLVVGVHERIDSNGEIIFPLNEDLFLEQLRGLVDKGPRAFVVSLLWSFLNPIHEQRIKELILQEFSDAYLGHMPVFLTSEVAPRIFEYPRTMMTILNAYLHQEMYRELSGISQELRDREYRRPLMLVHNTGGMASVFKTSAVNTFNGGPVAGVMGGHFLEYGVLSSHHPSHGQHWGILAVQLGVGITVAAVMIAIFFAFAGRRKSS